MILDIEYGEIPKDRYNYDDAFFRTKRFESSLLMGDETLEEKIVISVNSIRKAREL